MEVFGQMFLNGHVYRGKKPVHWSPSSMTALAEVRLVPIRRRWRGERRSLRTFAVISLRPPLAFNPRPRRLSTPSDAFELHPDVASYGTTISSQGGVLTPDA